MNKSYLSFMKDFEPIESPSEHYELIQNTKTQQRFIVQTTYPQNVPLLKLKTKTLEQHLNVEHQYILPLYKYFTSQARQLTLTAIYRTGLHTLFEQVEARAQQKKYFKENEIWAILYGIISAMSYIQSQGIQCGSVSMDLIYLTDNGQAKIVDPSFINGITQLQRQKYYSPQQVALLISPNNESDIFKSNVFLTALCILHCCLLGGVYEYIDITTGNIDFDYLEQMLQQTSQMYSEDLVRLLVDMLDQELGSRPDFIQLQQHMSKICVLQQTGSKTLPCPIDNQPQRDQKYNMDFFDQMNEPDIGEGTPQESNQPQLPKLQLNPLQMSLSNNSSVDINKLKSHGLDQIKNVKIADSLSYSGIELQSYKPVQASYGVKNSFDIKPKDSYIQKSYIAQSSFAPIQKFQVIGTTYSSYLPKYQQNPLPTYSYTASSYTPLISNTDESGLFTSPQLLSFLKVDLRPPTDENFNPNSN